MVAADGSALRQAGEQPGSALIKAVVRVFRWKRMIESGQFGTINDLAAAEGIALSYMTRVLRMPLSSAGCVETFTVGNQDSDVTLGRMLQPFSGKMG